MAASPTRSAATTTAARCRPGTSSARWVSIPSAPASDYYVIGSPAIPKAVVHLSNGKTLTMVAQDLSDKNIYVQSLTVNGKAWASPFLPYREIKDGGELVFVMGPEPNKQWGIDTTLPE